MTENTCLTIVHIPEKTCLTMSRAFAIPDTIRLILPIFSASSVNARIALVMFQNFSVIPDNVASVAGGNTS